MDELKVTIPQKLNKEEEFTFFCDCGCGGIRFYVYDYGGDDEMIISVFQSSFYSEQDNKFAEKLKRIWAIVSGKEYRLYEMVLNSETKRKFIDVFGKMFWADKVRVNSKPISKIG